MSLRIPNRNGSSLCLTHPWPIEHVFPHKAAVSIYEINYAARLGRGQHPDVSFSFGFSQQYLF